MGRLIDTNDIRVKPQYMQDVMGIAMIRCEDLSRILADVPTVEAIPKDQYEARLKADMMAMLTEIQLEIEELKNEPSHCHHFERGIRYSSNIIQQKINALRGEENESGNNQ